MRAGRGSFEFTENVCELKLTCQAKWSCCLLIKRSQMKGVTFTYHWKKYSWYYATGCTLPKDEHILVEFLVIAVQMYWVHYKKVYWSMFYMKILLQSCNSVLLKSVFLSTFKRVLVFKVNLCCTSVILKAQVGNNWHFHINLLLSRAACHKSPTTWP